jgi:hypothetical protein
MPDLTQFKTYDEAANAFQASKQYRKLADPAAQVDAMHTLRDKYYEAHGVHKDVGPTDITPPTPSKGEGGETAVPEKVDATPKAPVEGEQPDAMGRVKAGAEKGLGELQDAAGSMRGEVDPIAILVHALPGDNIQAGIDAAMALSMLTGAGEVEGAGGLAYKALRELPEGARGIGRLAARMVAPTVGGAVGGATEGKTGQGAAKGAAEQAGGEVISGVGRGIFGLSAKSIQKTDLRSVGNWLSEQLPDFPGMKSIADFRKWFLRGELEDAASDKLGKVESKIGRALSPKGATTIPQATVFSPSAQNTAQDEALAAVKGEKPGAMGETTQEPPKTVFTIIDEKGGRLNVTDKEGYLKDPNKPMPWEKKEVSSEIPPKTVFAKKPADPDAAYKKVRDLQQELKRAKSQGQGSRVQDEIRASLKQAQEDARGATKAAKTGDKPVDLKAAVADSQAKGAQTGAKPSTYQSPRAEKAVTPTLKVELPGPMADYLKMPRRSPLDFEWKDLTTHLNETENKGWALIGNPDPEKAELGKALRSSVFQAEHDAADALRQKIGDKIADEWLTQRQQYRAARVLTQLFRTPNLVDARGSIAWDEVQKLVDQSGREGFYDDLKLAFGKDGADAFIDKLTRNAPNERDIPGRGVLTTHSRVYMHPGLGKLSPRIPLQIPVPTVRAGDVPFNLGRNRALSAMMVLGPERFVQMIDDMSRMGSAAQQPNK